MHKRYGIKCAAIGGGGGDFLQEFYSKLNIWMVQYIQKMDPVEQEYRFLEMDRNKLGTIWSYIFVPVTCRFENRMCCLELDIICLYDIISE